MKTIEPTDDDARKAAELSLPLDAICHVIEKAREFAVKTAATDPDASAMDDDDIVAATLEDRPSDPVEEELRAALSDLTHDAQIDLVALMWLGRDGAALDEWPELRRIAADAHDDGAVRYLCGTPLLADHLSAGLEALSLDCRDFLVGRI